MFRFNAAGLAVMIAAAGLMLGGCMTPPVRWRHDAGERQFEPGGYALLVKPLEDARALANEPAPWWRWLPLVPWATETDAAFDLVLAHSGSKRGSAPDPIFRFDAANDLHWAAVRQMGVGGLFAPVFKLPADVGAWPGHTETLCTMTVRITTLTLERRHWRYGLGPLAPAAFALGAPRTRYTLIAALEFAIADPAGREIASEGVVTGIKATDGWYFQRDAKQRILDELSFQVGAALDALQAECQQKLKSEDKL